jgi:hypothetical protein
MRCSSTVCPIQWVWGAFYRQERSVERVGPFSQVRPDQGVWPALWSTASRPGRSWSLLLRRLRVGSLGRFFSVWRLGGAAGPTPCREMNRLPSGTPRIALEWWLWQLIGRTSGPIDPSDPTLIHSIKPTVSLVDLVLPSCARGRGGVLDQWCATGQVRPHLEGSAAPVGPAALAWPVTPIRLVVPSPCGTLVPILP